MRVYESLWNTLLDHLDREGLLPIQAVRLTPSEIARHVHLKSGDERVTMFVWGYLYPKKYGRQAGVLTDKKARQLVATFEKTKKTKPATLPIGLINNGLAKPRMRCEVCLERWPATDEVEH